MILSGKNFRSIADQTGDYSYVFNVITKTRSSDIHVGLTGDYNIDYKFAGGKIFDRNTGFVDSYSNNSSFIISGNLKNNQHEYFINGVPKVVGETLPNGKISGVFAINEQPENIGFTFFGQTPSYSITTSSDKIVADETLTGFINNIDPPLSFTVFSGELVSSDVPVDFSIDTYQEVTGYELLGGAKFLLTPSQSQNLSGVADLLFYTNFGQIEYAYSLTGGNLPSTIRSSSYLNIQPFVADFDGLSGSITVTSYYADFNGANIGVSLSHLSGQTGDIFRDKAFFRDFSHTEDAVVTGINTVSISKTGLVSGLDASGVIQTGVGTGILTGYAEPTGQIVNDYELLLTGLGSGIVDTDINLAGMSTTRFSGFVPFGSQVITGIVNNIIGTGTFNEEQLTGIIRTGYGASFFDPANFLPDGEVNLQPGAYTTEIVRKFISYTGEITGYYDITGSGIAGYITETGIVDQNFLSAVKRGVYTYEKIYDTTISGFEDLFMADTVGEVVFGELPEATGDDVGFTLTGDFIASKSGACFEDLPTIEVSGYNTNYPYNFHVANLLLSLSRVNPGFTGCIMTVQRASDGESKDIYFYNNYINIENVKQFAQSGEVFVTEWKDQSLNKNNYVPNITERPKLLTGAAVFNSGICFDRSLLKTINPLGFVDENAYSIEFSGGSVGYSGSSYYNPSIDIENLNRGWDISMQDELIYKSFGTNVTIPANPIDSHLFIDGIGLNQEIYVGNKISDIHIFPYRNLGDVDRPSYLFDEAIGEYRIDEFEFLGDDNCNIRDFFNIDRTIYALAPEFTFQLNDRGDEYTLIECLKSASGDKEIPSTHLDTSQSPDELPVVAIGNSAFLNCANITNIIIPDSVVTIGSWAFFGCSGLTSITIHDFVNFIDIGAFNRCTSLTSISFGDRVRVIAGMLLGNCTSLTSVTIPDGVTHIGQQSFDGCSSLPSITIPNSVRFIYSLAFRGCTSLSSITIPNSVELIAAQAFANCRSLTSIFIPYSVQTLGTELFFDCSSLTSAVLPVNLASIPRGTFGHCDSLNSFTIPNSVKVIEEGAFGHTAFNTIAIPNGVREIGRGAFTTMPNLTTITFPASVNSIGPYTFKDCNNLATVNFLSKNAPTLNPIDTSIAEPNATNFERISATTINVPANAIGYGTNYDGLSVSYSLPNA